MTYRHPPKERNAFGRRNALTKTTIALKLIISET